MNDVNLPNWATVSPKANQKDVFEYLFTGKVQNSSTVFFFCSCLISYHGTTYITCIFLT